MPRYLIVGKQATLRCHLALEGDVLYSLKWWKDGKQFYQYIPQNNPPNVVFTVPGITVNVSMVTCTLVAARWDRENVEMYIGGSGGNVLKEGGLDDEKGVYRDEYREYEDCKIRKGKDLAEGIERWMDGSKKEGRERRAIKKRVRSGKESLGVTCEKKDGSMET